MNANVIEKESRAQAMKRRVIEAPYSICIERARYVTEAFRRTEGMNPSWRAACAFENTAKNMTIFILDEEQIVGNYCDKIVGTLLPVERGEMNLILEMDINNLQNRKDHPYQISSEDKKELLEDILPYWRGKTVRDGKKALFQRENLIVKPGFTPGTLLDLTRSFGTKQLISGLWRMVRGRARHIKRASEEIPINNPNLVNNVFDVQGHLIIGHNRMIASGFKAARDRAAEKLKESLPEEKRKFLESVILSCETARLFAGRFAALARDKAAAERDPARKIELLAIADRADRLPWLPPESFADALQFLWFTQVLSNISYGMTGICAIGRPDQYLYPFFKKDIENGSLNSAQALELIEELIVKLSNNLIMLPSYGKDTGSELGADSMAPTFGGLGPDGEDATNELSFLFLDAISNVKGMSNSYSVRVSSKTTAEFHNKLAESHRASLGIAIFNDDVIIPAMLKCGYSVEEARDYGIIGCVEPTSQGNTFGCTSGNDISLTGVLEMTLTGGRIKMIGHRVGPDTGDATKFKSFDELLVAFRKQLHFIVGHVARCVNVKDEVYANGFHNPYISTTLEGCVENSEDMTQGGAKYNFASISARGLGTTADSLAAIKKFVFDENKLTMPELLAALGTNFRKREQLRRMLEIQTPRYGSDNDSTDSIARDIAAMFCEEVTSHKSYRKGGMFRPGFFSYGMHIFDGSMLGATPDGRLAGQPVSNSLSPSTGSETRGPTAVMLSAAKIDHKNILNGSSLNMKLLPSLLQTKEGREKFSALLKAYFSLGGLHVQFNVVDNKTLIDAQLHPDNYRDLVVRVSGYSAYFTDLGRPLQDDIIRRTEFAGF